MSGPKSPRTLTGPLRFAKAIGAAPLGRSEKAILFSYSERVNYQTWEAWPGVRDLAERSGLGRRTVQLGLDRLEARGVITFLRRSKGGIGRNGKGYTHHIRINIETLEAMNGADGHPLPALAPSDPTAQEAQTKGAATGANGAGQHQEHIHPSDHRDKQTMCVRHTETAKPDDDRRPETRIHPHPRDGWMVSTTEETTDVRGALRGYGVQGANLETLAAMPGLDAARVHDEWRAIRADFNVRNPAAVLVRRLAQETGAKLSLRDKLGPSAFGFIGKVEELRRQRGYGQTRAPGRAWE